MYIFLMIALLTVSAHSNTVQYNNNALQCIFTKLEMLIFLSIYIIICLLFIGDSCGPLGYDILRGHFKVIIAEIADYKQFNNLSNVLLVLINNSINKTEHSRYYMTSWQGTCVKLTLYI